MDFLQRSQTPQSSTGQPQRSTPGGIGGIGNQGRTEALAGASEGPFSEAANASLSAMFGTSLAGLGATLDPGAADALDADAYTEGSEMTFGPMGASLFSSDTPDDEALALGAHEVAHALAGGGSGAQELDGPGDSGEALADAAESRMRQWTRSGQSGAAPQAGPASGGKARVHRRSTSGGSFSGRPALRYGSRGSQVKALQALLNRHGAGLPTTGYFGNMTLSAVKDFQRRNGLGVDGIAGPATAGALQRGGGSGGGSASGWNGSPLLEYGMRSEQVRALQTQLNARGAKLPTTGYFGNMTLAALQAFQRANGLTVDGKAGKATHRALQQAHDDAKTSDDHQATCSLSGSPALKRGSRGSQVRELQSLLNKQGERLAVDGIFGRGTDAAVRRFQQKQGLTVDGVVGPGTARALASCSTGGKTDDKKDEPAPTPAPADGGGGGAGEVKDADPKSVLTSPNLHPQVRSMAGQAVRQMQAQGLRPYVFEGYRSFARQNDLYNGGRGVTKVRGGGSYHNYGLAVDIVFWNDRGTGPSWDGKHPWKHVGEAGKAAGFTQWGGDWGWDMPHLQYHPGHRGSAYDLLPAYNRGGLSAVWESLGTDLSTINATTTWDGVLSGEIELRNGTSGQAVRTLQEKLNAHGAGITVDGKFGSGTEGAVKAFQRAQGIAETGVVDQATARKF